MSCKKGGKGNTPPPNFNTNEANAPGNPDAPGGANNDGWSVGNPPTDPINTNTLMKATDSGTPNNVALNEYEVQQYSERDSGIEVNMTNPLSTFLMKDSILNSVGVDPLAPALLHTAGTISSDSLVIFTSDKFDDDGSGELENMRLDLTTGKTGYAIVSNASNVPVLSLTSAKIIGTIQLNGSTGLVLVDSLIISGVNLPIVENNSGTFVTLINCVIQCDHHTKEWIKGNGQLILHNCTYTGSATEIPDTITIIEPTTDLEDKYGKAREYQTPELKYLSDSFVLDAVNNIYLENSSIENGNDSLLIGKGEWVGYSEDIADVMSYNVNWFAEGIADNPDPLDVENLSFNATVINNSTAKVILRLDISRDDGVSWDTYGTSSEVFNGTSAITEGNFTFNTSAFNTPIGNMISLHGLDEPHWRITATIEQNGATPVEIDYVKVTVSNVFFMKGLGTGFIMSTPKIPYAGFKYTSLKNDKHITILPDGSHSLDDESLEIIQIAPNSSDAQYILPDATARKGRVLKFRNLGEFGINVQGFEGQMVNNAPNNYIESGTYLELTSDGGNWFITLLTPLDGVVNSFGLKDIGDYRDYIVHFWDSSTASSTGSGTVDDAIDNDEATAWKASTNTNEFYGVRFNKPTNINSIMFNSWLDGDNYSGINDFLIKASNGPFSGEEDTLFSGARENFNGNEFYGFAQGEEYLEYRIYITNSHGANIGISTLSMFNSPENPEGALLAISPDFNRIQLKRLALQDLSDIQPYAGNPNKELVVASNEAEMQYKYEGAKKIVTLDTNNQDVFNTESVILLDAAGGNFQCFLADPNVIENRGKILTFVKIDSSANSFTVNADFTTINGVSTKVLTSQYDKLTIIGIGGEWLEI